GPHEGDGRQRAADGEQREVEQVAAGHRTSAGGSSSSRAYREASEPGRRARPSGRQSVPKWEARAAVAARGFRSLSLLFGSLGYLLRALVAKVLSARYRERC